LAAHEIRGSVPVGLLICVEVSTSSITALLEISGAEALWLLEGSSLGRLVYPQREPTVVRPARHLLRLHPQSVTGFLLARGEA
jgi:hypothetical protein